MKSLKTLKVERQKLLIRIEKLENELKKSLKKDPDANAVEEEDREVLNSLYQVEKNNLKKLDEDIATSTFSI